MICKFLSDFFSKPSEVIIISGFFIGIPLILEVNASVNPVCTEEIPPNCQMFPGTLQKQLPFLLIKLLGRLDKVRFSTAEHPFSPAGHCLLLKLEKVLSLHFSVSVAQWEWGGPGWSTKTCQGHHFHRLQGAGAE